MTSEKNNNKKERKLTYDPRELQELFKEKGLPSQFCMVPFSNLILNPNGDIGVCRQKGTEHIVGNILKESLEDIWNNEYLQKWRTEFITGNIEICKREVATDACHLSADNYVFFPEIDLNTYQKNMPIKLTANFNGKCNLKCTMCDVWMMENGLYDNIGFWERCETEFFPYIKEIELLSGEPFIQKDTYRLIDMIAKVNPQVLWSITTNAFWKWNPAIEKALDKIEIKNIILSIDSLNEERYAQIRRGGNLKQVLETLEYLRLYEKRRLEAGRTGLGLTLHFLVMKNNWRELPLVADFIEDKGMRLTVNNCCEPEELSLWDYSAEEELQIGLELVDSCSPSQLRKVTRSLLAIAHDLPRLEKATLMECLSLKVKAKAKVKEAKV